MAAVGRAATNTTKPASSKPAKQSNRLTRTTVGNGLNFIETYTYTDAQGNDVHGCMTAINSMKMEWDFKDQLQKVDLGGGGTAYYVYDAGGQRVRKVIETQNGTLSEERLYLGGFEIYRKFGTKRAASARRCTSWTTSSASPSSRRRRIESGSQISNPQSADPLPARQPPRLGQPGIGQGRRADLLRGVSPLRHDGVSSHEQRRRGEPEALSLHGQGAG